MKNSRLYLLLLIMLTTFSSCEDGFFKCIDGSGPITEEIRVIGYFDDLRIQENYSVYIKQDTFNQVLIRAEENLLAHIDTRKNGDKLTLTTRNSRCLRSDEQIEVFITTKGLNTIKLSSSGLVDIANMDMSNLDLSISGSGGMSLRNLQTDDLNATITGSGQIELQGSGKRAEFKTTGSGTIRGVIFTVEDCLAEILGSGSIFIDVTNLLDVEISGSGSIHYSGNPPNVFSTVTGSGRLIKI